MLHIISAAFILYAHYLVYEAIQNPTYLWVLLAGIATHFLAKYYD